MSSQRLVAVIAFVVIPAHAPAQEWVTITPGAGVGDSGSAVKSILRREIIYPHKSPLGTMYNHPSGICQCRDGTVVIMWNAGPAEGDSRNRLAILRRGPKDKDWAEPVHCEPNGWPDATSKGRPEKGGKPLDIGAIYQPRRKDAPLIVWYYWGGNPERGTGALRTSDDNGKTWSDRILCPETKDPFFAARGGRFVGCSKGLPVELTDGTLICPTHRGGFRKGVGRASAVLFIPPDNYTGARSADAPWKLTYPDPDKNVSGHPELLTLSQDRTHLALVGRTAVDGVHNIAESKDGGKTWSDPVSLPQDCGKAGVGTVSLDVDGGPAQGWHICCGSVHPRNGLAVALSKTPLNPDSWKQVLVLNKDEDNEDADPALVQAADRKVHLVFTGRGTKGGPLKYYVLDPDLLMSEK